MLYMTYLARLRCDIGEIVAESAEQPSATLAPQEVKADAALLAVDFHNQGNIMGILACLAACAQALGEIKTNLLLGVQAVQ